MPPSRDLADADPDDALLLERASELQSEALSVLADLDLRARLELLGIFEQVGSSASGLMVHPDIDLCVRADRPSRSAAFAALQPVLADPRVVECLYCDETGPRSPTGRPSDQRHYFVLRHERRPDRIWKIDITVWVSDHARPHLSEVQRLLEASHEQRLAILRIKHAWHRLPAYGQTIGGLQIYEAVLEAGIRTPAEFGRWLVR